MRRRSAAACALMLVVALPLSAQDSRLAGRLDAPVLNTVSPLLDSVRAAGLPTEPLVDKALEGASKGASGTRILAAMRALAGDLGLARAALGGGAREPELVAGAAAIRAGATRNDLVLLRSEREGSLTVPLAVLANLVARGVPSDTAAAVVHQLAARGAPDQEFTELQLEVERDIGTGASPATAASVRGRARTGGSPQATPAGSNPGRGNPGNPGGGAGKPGNSGSPGGKAGNPGGGRPGNAGPPGQAKPPRADNPGRGNPGAGRDNPGRGGSPPGRGSNPGRSGNQRPR